MNFFPFQFEVFCIFANSNRKIKKTKDHVQIISGKAFGYQVMDFVFEMSLEVN